MQLELGSSAQKILGHLTELLAAGETCHLVGGAVRDALRGVASRDLDFATPGDPTALARRLARESGGSWFPLDDERHQSRVVLRQGEEGVTCDFAPYRGPDLEADLSRRDFTINALALPIGSAWTVDSLIDPTGGREDLRRGILRACFSGTFRDDPLRALRGVRFAAALGFEIESLTAELLTSAVKGLHRVAAERIRAEIGALFSFCPAGPGIRLLHETALDEAVFRLPAIDFDLGLCLERIESIDRALASATLPGCLEEACREPLEEGIRGATALRIGTFLRHWNPSESEWLLRQRLRLGRRAVSVIHSVVALRSEEGERLRSLPPTRRGRALWAATLGPQPGADLLWLAVCESSEPTFLLEQAEQVCRSFRELCVDGKIPDLVSGAWISKNLDLRGPAIGSALEALRRAEMKGRVNSPVEARNFLISQYAKGVDKE